VGPHRHGDPRRLVRRSPVLLEKPAVVRGTPDRVTEHAVRGDDVAQRQVRRGVGGHLAPGIGMVPAEQGAEGMTDLVLAGVVSHAEDRVRVRRPVRHRVVAFEQFRRLPEYRSHGVRALAPGSSRVALVRDR
jgi:hypothetical protein